MTDKAIQERLLSTAAAEQWKAAGIRHHHGIAVPLFSLHTASSCGLGEYPDLLPLIDWCSEAGLDVIQLLPLNDTGHDNSPYSALSAFALNPLHLGLSRLPSIGQDAAFTEAIKRLRALTTATQRVDYRALFPLRDKLLKDYVQKYGQEIKQEPGYGRFIEDNLSWITPYATYKALKSKYGWKRWEEWPQGGQADPFETDYHKTVQYLCFKQFAEVKKYAEKMSVLLKGDIPILINRDSADVWGHQDTFRLGLAAGAPPDMYCKEGQKWGFPLYKWDVLEKTGYRWWTGRLDLAARCYHLYRIDHVVGFFRIWGIPLAAPAREGHFVPEDERTWIPHGEKIMKMMLARCPMLPIGEDLGTVPPEVRVCLKKLGICGTKVMRWERFWEGDRSFIPPADYPAESMTTVSTHDSETLAQWWHDQPEEARLYCRSQGWDYVPELSGGHRLSILRASHHSGSLFHINLFQEYLALIPGMTWPKLEDERINVPGVISDKNWSFRFKCPLEEIARSSLLKQKMSEILLS